MRTTWTPSSGVPRIPCPPLGRGWPGAGISILTVVIRAAYPAPRGTSRGTATGTSTAGSVTGAKPVAPAVRVYFPGGRSGTEKVPSLPPVAPLETAPERTTTTAPSTGEPPAPSVTRPARGAAGPSFSTRAGPPQKTSEATAWPIPGLCASTRKGPRGGVAIRNFPSSPVVPFATSRPRAAFAGTAGTPE